VFGEEIGLAMVARVATLGLSCRSTVRRRDPESKAAGINSEVTFGTRY